MSKCIPASERLPEESIQIKNHDLSKIVFSQGIVCLNTNNMAYCIVVNGNYGYEDDRYSLIIEDNSYNGFMIRAVPNRVLVPTGKIYDLNDLLSVLRNNITEE